jgi:hypothetical protein
VICLRCFWTLFGTHIPSAPAEDPVGVLRGSSNDRRGGGVERLLDVLRVESDLQPALATVDEHQLFRERRRLDGYRHLPPMTPNV